MDPIYLLLIVPLVPWTFCLWLLVREAREEELERLAAVRRPNAGAPRIFGMPAVLRVVGQRPLDVMGMN
jgi:hypothetical protein